MGGPAKGRRGCNSGFTLTELMVSIAILGILASLMLPALARGKDAARRTLCRNHLKQLVMACGMYADDDKDGSFTDALHDTEDNFNFLFHGYVKPHRVYMCPSARNIVRPDQWEKSELRIRDDLVDLGKFAGGPRGNGSSFEIFGFMNNSPNAESVTEIHLPSGEILRSAGLRKSQSNVSGYRHQFDTFGFRGVMPGPAAIWLVVDGDDGPGPSHQNYPEKGDNHGAPGANVSFADGHVEWVKVHEFLRRYELSQDENRGSL